MKLRITLPDQEPFEVEVPKEQITLGRASTCDVVVPSPYVSKAHLRLFRGLVALDLGSINGTFLPGGKRLEGASLVTDGHVTIGPENIRVDILEPEEKQNDELEKKLRELQAINAGLEHELGELRNDNDYLRLQVESMRKADATRTAVEELSKAQLKKQGKDIGEFDRLTKAYTEVLKKLQTDIDSRLKKRTAHG